MLYFSIQIHMENQINVGDQNTQQIGQNSANKPISIQEKPKVNYLVIGIVVLVCFIVFGLGGYYLGKQSTMPPPSSLAVDGEKIIASEVTLEGCKIKVTTNKREIFLNTSFLESNPQTKCYQFVLNLVSPSGKYVVFQDISGGLDSQIRVYSLGHNKDIALDVLGSSTIKYMGFLPDDRLAAINGYFGYFGKEWLGQWLRIYDIPSLFNSYPDTVDSQYNYFKLSDDNLAVVDLPDKGTDYASFSVDGRTIKLFGPGDSGTVIYSLNLDSFSSNAKTTSTNYDQAISLLEAIPEIRIIQSAVIKAGRKPFFIPEGESGEIVTVSLRESFPEDAHTSRIDTFNVNIKSGVITVDDVAMVSGSEMITLEEWKKTVKERFQ